MRILLVFLLTVFLIPAFSFAQTLPFQQKGFRVSVRPSLARKAKVQWNNVYSPRANNFISLGAGFDYFFPVAKNLSLVTGLHGLWHGSNFSFYVPGIAFQPALDYDLDERGKTSGGLLNGIVSAQVSLEKRWITRKENIWFLSAGAALNDCTTSYVESYYSVQHNNQQILYAYRYYNTENHGRPYVSGHLAAGRYWKIGKRQCFLTSLVADYSFGSLARGYYWIHPPGRPEVRGFYNMDGSYAGIDFAYVLPRK